MSQPASSFKTVLNIKRLQFEPGAGINKMLTEFHSKFKPHVVQMTTDSQTLQKNMLSKTSCSLDKVKSPCWQVCRKSGSQTKLLVQFPMLMRPSMARS